MYVLPSLDFTSLDAANDGFVKIDRLGCVWSFEGSVESLEPDVGARGAGYRDGGDQTGGRGYGHANGAERCSREGYETGGTCEVFEFEGERSDRQAGGRGSSTGEFGIEGG